MENLVTERFKELIRVKSGTANSFSSEIGISQSTLSCQLNSVRGISSIVISIALQRYPDISAEWLMRGKGSMYIEDELSTYTGNEDEDLLFLKAKYDKLKIEHDAEIEEHHKLIGQLEYMEDYNQRLSQEIGHLKERLRLYEPEKKDII